MSIDPNNYTGSTAFKVSTLLKLAMDILSLANDVAHDPAIATDIAAIQQDITELFSGVQIMELPQVAPFRDEPEAPDAAQ
jgi:hypothetical protein